MFHNFFLLGIIPYSFDAASGYTVAEKSIITGAMRKIENQTENCLRFKERTTEKNWVVFKVTYKGCNSKVGKVETGSQVISIDRPTSSNSGHCVFQGIVIHELLHAAGFQHEHQRPDRDQYIKVIYENIEPGHEQNFYKFNKSDVNLFNIPYDYYSIMHYKYNAFGFKGAATMMPLDPSVNLTLMGNRIILDYLMPSDINMIKLFYECPNALNSSFRSTFDTIILFILIFLAFILADY